MWEEFWVGRGSPWEFDRGPARTGRYAELFAETPNYRGMGRRWSGSEEFRWHYGPMFYRGRLDTGEARVLVVGQEGAQDESLAHRSFTGSTGGRMQHFLGHLGITRSYQFLNTFVYPIHGQYDDGLRPLAQDTRSPIVRHRHAIFDHTIDVHPVRLVIAVGLAAKESVATWIRAHGGSADPRNLSNAEAHKVTPGLRAIGVPHPGGAANGASIRDLTEKFTAALAEVSAIAAADPGWLPADDDGTRRPAGEYRYLAAPVPFRDFAYGTPWRLGFKTTSSNRRDSQTAIQLFSKDGKYNNKGHVLSYPSLGSGSDDGYDPDPGDLPYEPPRDHFEAFDPGPPTTHAQLLQGGLSGFGWPDFAALGLPGHPSFGFGPIYRGRLTNPSVLVLADQGSHDDLVFARALCGEAGQRLQGLLRAAGLTKKYAVLRTLPVDSLGAPAARVRAAADHPQVRAVLAEAMRRSHPKVVLGVGKEAARLAPLLAPAGVPVATMKAHGASGWLADWKRALHDLSTLTYPKDTAASFTWDGSRLQIPRHDLPFGTLRWQATSGDRVARATRSGDPTPDYYKVVMPGWAAALDASPVSAGEAAAVDALKQ